MGREAPQPLSCILRRPKSRGPTLRAIPGCSRIGLKCPFASAALKLLLLQKPGLWGFAFAKVGVEWGVLSQSCRHPLYQIL